MPDQSPQNMPSDEISLKELILKLREWYRYLRSKWLIILIAGIIGGALGLAYSIYKKPVYTATLTFALEEKSPGSSLGAYAGLASQFGIDLGGGASGVFSGDNIMELMKSRLMVSKTLLSSVNINGREQSLADYYININKLRDSRKGHLSISNPSFRVNENPDSLSFPQDSIMGNFYSQIVKNNLTVDKTDKNSGIIAVKCKSGNELFSKYFTENLVENVTAFYIATKTKQAATNVNILQNRLDSVRREFNAALYGAATATDQNLNPVRAVVGVPRIKSQANVQILGTEYGELTKNLEVAKMALLQETPLIQVIDKPMLPLENNRLGKLKGIVIGGAIFCFLSILTLVLRLIYKSIMLEV